MERLKLVWDLLKYFELRNEWLGIVFFFFLYPRSTRFARVHREPYKKRKTQRSRHFYIS